MPDLRFSVEEAKALPFAVSPTIAFALRVANADPQEIIHTVVLRCQIQIEVTRRRYSAENKEKLRDLFGDPERWGQTLRNTLWTHATAIVPSFTGSTLAKLQVPCTFDFSVAATKYFEGLADGDIPLCLMFSGTVFYGSPTGALRVAPISWDKETQFRLPLKTWKEMMELYYPNTAWLCLRRDAFDRLYRYKVLHGVPTWEEAIERIITQTEEAIPS